MTSKTKRDFFNDGRADAEANATIPNALNHVPPKPGTWQRRAYDEGFAAYATARPVEGAQRRGNDPRVQIDVQHLGNLVEDWPAARQEHVRTLAVDYNAEVKQPRRLRLYKKVGKLFERHGVRAPIPTII